jgi:hypothetical protein
MHGPTHAREEKNIIIEERIRNSWIVTIDGKQHHQKIQPNATVPGAKKTSTTMMSIGNLMTRSFAKTVPGSG